MVFVGMGQDQRDQIITAAFDEVRVGHDYVDPRGGVVAEGDTAIDHQPFAGMTIEVQVHANLAGAAEWQKKQVVLAGYGADPG